MTAHTTGSIAETIGATLTGRSDLAVTHIDAVDRAGSGGLTFVRDAVFATRFLEGKASAAIVPRDVSLDGFDAENRAAIVVDDADLAMIDVLGLFAPLRPTTPGIHASATVDPDAEVHTSATVGPGATVGAGSHVDRGATIGAGVHIGCNVRVGAQSRLEAGSVIEDGSQIGQRCTIHANAVVGADGFGFHPGPDGITRIPHIGNVVIEDDVEIGAMSCVDRAKFGSTIVGAGTKIDNLVQIGHNCRIGRSCLICGHCGISGSVTIGDGVVLGGGVGVADNLTIGDGARVGAQGGVMNDIPDGETWIGYPAGPAALQGRNYAAFRKLAETLRELKKAVR